MDMNRMIRYLAFSLELLVLFMLQQTPGFFPEIYGAKPLLLIPGAVTIAMWEEETPAMVFGVFAGLLMDFGFGGALGISALGLGLLCYIVSALTKTVLQIHFITSLITAVWTVAVLVLLTWLTRYVMAGYAHQSYALLHRYLPIYLYTLLLFPLIYLLNRGIFRVLHRPE